MNKKHKGEATKFDGRKAKGNRPKAGQATGAVKAVATQGMATIARHLEGLFLALNIL